MHHFAHELHEARIVRGVLRTHRTQLGDLFPHRVVLGLALRETLVAGHDLAERGIEDFFFQLCMNFQCRAGKLDDGAFSPSRRLRVIAMKGRHHVRVIHADHGRDGRGTG